MKHPINYVLVPPNTQEFQQLQTFAESFDHKIIQHPKINVYAHYRDDICFGYSEHVFVPTVYPAFHPMLTKPQDVLQVMSDWRAHSQFSLSPAFVGVPLAESPGRANFPQKVMEKLGLARHEREIYTLA